MYEYKYKAKRVVDGEWTQGSLFAGLNNHFIIQRGVFTPDDEEEMKAIGSRVDKDTICRYAGMGFWERDIVLVCGRIGVIRYGYHEEGNGFYVDWVKTEEGDTKEALYNLLWVRVDKAFCLGNDIDDSTEDAIKWMEDLMKEFADVSQ